MKAVILAGGEGTRLRPLTLTIPKALVPVRDRTLTDQVLDILKKAGTSEVVLGISYLAEKIKDYFEKNPFPGIKIGYVIEQNRMGTAGPLILLKRTACRYDDNFFVVNGDNLFSLDLSAMIDFHKEHGGVATIALTAVEDVTKFGVARTKGDKIIDFIEKPKIEEAPSNLINSGYYIFSPEIFDYIDEAADFLMLEKDIFPQLAKAGKLYGFIGEGQWFDTGTPERYQAVKDNWRGV